MLKYRCDFGWESTRVLNIAEQTSPAAFTTKPHCLMASASIHVRVCQYVSVRVRACVFARISIDLCLSARLQWRRPLTYTTTTPRTLPKIASTHLIKTFAVRLPLASRYKNRESDENISSTGRFVCCILITISSNTFCALIYFSAGEILLTSYCTRILGQVVSDL